MSNEPTSWDRLTEEQLRALPIKRLVNILKLSRKRMNTSGHCGCCGEPWSAIYDEEDSRCIYAKESLAHFEMVKAICDEREHAERSK